LRSFSPKAYRYLREKKKFPLPGNNNSIKKKIIITIQLQLVGLSTLRTWAGNFSVEPGILNSVLTLMKAKGRIFIQNNLYFAVNKIVNLNKNF